MNPLKIINLALKEEGKLAPAALARVLPMDKDDIRVLREGCVKYNLSEQEFEELKSARISDVYFVFQSLKDWAEWYTQYWSWRYMQLTPEEFEKTNEKDWLIWLSNEPYKFYLTDSGKVVEHDWQSQKDRYDITEELNNLEIERHIAFEEAYCIESLGINPYKRNLPNAI